MSNRENSSNAEPERVIDEIPALEAEPAEEKAPDTESAADKKDSASEETEDFDYVVPELTYKKRHKTRRHKKRRKSKYASNPVDEEAEDYVFYTPRKKHSHHHHHHHKHHKKWPLWLKIVVIVVSVILALAIAVTSTYFILKEIGRKAMHDYGGIDVTIPLQDDSGKDAADILDKGRTIRYGGKTYRLNEDIITVTFIGFNEGEVGESDNYMADAIYVAAIDTNTGKTTILGVSRDTMLDVDVYSAEGQFIDTEKKQLSYAYSYGNDKVKGGANVNTSLTRLFFGLPFKNYFAINLEALSDLNDAIGGVTLTSMLTFESQEYGRTIMEGEEVTLYGKDVKTYVSSRDLSVLESNNDRMERQQQYIKAFLASIVPAAKKDLSTVTNLYGVVSENSDSTLDLPKVTYLASTAITKLRNADEIGYVRMNGTIKEGEHAELYLENKEVLETMLSIFYTPVP